MESVEQQITNGNVSDSVKSTNMPSKSTKSTSQDTRIMATQPELFQTISQISISSVVDSLAKHLALREKEGDSKTLAALCSLKSHGFYPLKDLNYCSWKMSPDFSHTIKGEPLQPSSQRFLTWGIFVNGRYLTARISVSPKTGKGCSLSDILEEVVDEKYFLSQAMAKRILNYQHSQHAIGGGKLMAAICVKSRHKEPRKQNVSTNQKDCL